MAPPIKRAKKVKRGPGRPFVGRRPFLIHMLPDEMLRLRRAAGLQPVGQFIEEIISSA